MLQSLPDDEQNDKWSFIWGNDMYSVSKAYHHLMWHEYVHQIFKWICRSCYQMKQKVFFWLLQNRLNTRGMLRRRNMVLDTPIRQMK
jgi:GH15 family glucan-1,4-alpha-glucosidase